MSGPAGAALAILLALIHTAAGRGRAIVRGDTKIFPPSLVIRAALFLGGFFFLVLGVGFSYHLGWHEAKWLSSGFLGFALLEIVAWPATILVQGNGVQLVHLFRRTVTIPEGEILAVVYDPAQLTTTVCGVNATIVHGNYSVDSQGFRDLLGRWVKVEERPMADVSMHMG